MTTTPEPGGPLTVEYRAYIDGSFGLVGYSDACPVPPMPDGARALSQEEYQAMSGAWSQAREAHISDLHRRVSDTKAADVAALTQAGIARETAQRLAGVDKETPALEDPLLAGTALFANSLPGPPKLPA